MTRLLNTPIIGPSAKTVDSSWIDMLAGLSGEYIFRMPPDFCANAGPTANRATSNGAAGIANALRCCFISLYLRSLIMWPVCRALVQNEGYLSRARQTGHNY